MSTVSDLLEQARARIAELEPLVEEYQRLSQVVRALESTPTDPAQSKEPRRRGGHRAQSGRGEQALAYVANHPGAKVAEIADAMGIGSTYLYRVLPRLEREGRLHKEGAGYFLPE